MLSLFVPSSDIRMCASMLRSHRITPRRDVKTKRRQRLLSEHLGDYPPNIQPILFLLNSPFLECIYQVQWQDEIEVVVEGVVAIEAVVVVIAEAFEAGEVEDAAERLCRSTRQCSIGT